MRAQRGRYARRTFRPMSSRTMTGRNTLTLRGCVADNQRRKNIRKEDKHHMTTETILARVNAAMALCEGPTPVHLELSALRDDLAAQVRKEAASSRGVGNAAATITRMLNGLKKTDKGRIALHYAWIDDKGRQCVCDGFRAYRLNEPLPLEPRPDDAGNGIDLDKVVPKVDGKTFDALPLPSVADLKAHIALERAENGRKHCALWDFGPGRPVVSAAYLLDLMAVLPDAAEIFVQRGPAGLFSPLYVKSERGDAVLLPIRNPDNTDRAAQAQAIQDAYNAAEMLRAYAAKIERNALHSMSLDDFAALAQIAYQA